MSSDNLVPFKGIITQCSQSTTKSGSPYCTITVQSLTSSLSLNVWGTSSPQLPLWSMATVCNIKTNPQGSSCSGSDITISKPSPDLLSLIPSPTSQSEWSNLVSLIVNLIESHPFSYGSASVTPSEFFKNSALKVYQPYSKAPAAKVNHHNYPGGLLTHTFQLLNIYHHIFPSLPFSTNPFIVSIACLFHDYLKLSEYNPTTFDYQPTLFLKGHVVGSAEVLGSLMSKYQFDSLLILHCQHAILAHHGTREWGSPVLPSTPEAFLVHHLDMLSGHGTIYQTTPNNTKSFPLSTTVFHYPNSI